MRCGAMHPAQPAAAGCHLPCSVWWCKAPAHLLVQQTHPPSRSLWIYIDHYSSPVATLLHPCIAAHCFSSPQVGTPHSFAAEATHPPFPSAHPAPALPLVAPLHRRARQLAVPWPATHCTACLLARWAARVACAAALTHMLYCCSLVLALRLGPCSSFRPVSPPSPPLLLLKPL